MSYDDMVKEYIARKIDEDPNFQVPDFLWWNTTSSRKAHNERNAKAFAKIAKENE